MAPITCKLSYGDEIRRITFDKSSEVTYERMCNCVNDFFGLAPQSFKLQYTDDEGDTITMSTESEMKDAVKLVKLLDPIILRLYVKLRDSPPIKDTAPAKEPAGSTGRSNDSDLARTISHVAEHLPKVLEQLPSSPAYCSVMKNVCEHLPNFIESLPANVKAQMPNVELDVGATIAANIAKLQKELSGVSFSVHGGASGAPGTSGGMKSDGCGYGDPNVHPGITCDKSGMCPIVGPRFNLKGHDYDLCEAEFNKLDPAEQAKFVRIEPPFGRTYGCKKEGGGCPAKEAFKEAMRQGAGVHPGVTCDKSGMRPIVGPRFNLKGHNYDLCEAEFNKLDPAEQAKFVRIEPPVPPCMQWRKKGWPRGHSWGGHGWGGHGWGYGGHGWGSETQGGGFSGSHHAGAAPKLAARFVADVSIFDGTQMPAGTKFTKIWRLKNVGEVAWPAGTKLLFVGGDQMSAELTVPIDDESKIVMPGEEVDVAVDMIAPKELGRYLGYWRLVGPRERRRFGQRIWCHIQVVDPAASEQPEDPAAAEAEFYELMSRSSQGNDDEDDEENDGAEAMSTGAQTDVSLPTKTEEKSHSVASSAIMPGMSSEVSSATSSAISVHVERAAPTDVKIEVKTPGNTSLAKDEKRPDELLPMPADPPAVSEAESIATQLMQMGFEDKLVQLVMEKNSAIPFTEQIETCTRDLIQLSEWDSMLDDLEEMGFANREMNKRLLVKNDGSVKRTVKDLVGA
ncbi:hypothetical protein AB1Y20_000513 [Prymnesium parvum]|uniref:PB1 domain-containing protein n=1 Tax=Prymnesium parvum TaxID=97485 RepID=A0AB34KAM6_PRYPA